MRIVLCEFNQESNSFNPDITKRDSFEYYGIYLGADMITNLKNKPRAIAGMLDVIEEWNATAIPACSMYSQSGGRIDHCVLEWFLEKTLLSIQQNVPVDGVFVSLHGATQTTECDDVCGLILEKIRMVAGDHVVISASADLHANITRKIVKNADLICGFHTYPHTDYYETGVRAAKLAMQTLVERKKYHQIRVEIPMVVPANGYSTLQGPFAELMKYGRSLVQSKKLTDFSIFMMQPWLDVKEGASTVIAIAEDRETAQKYAVDMAQRLFKERNSFHPEMYSIEQVIKLAENDDIKKPVVLVDSADSSNAGAAGDSVAVVKKILETGSDLKTASVLTDAQAVEQAHTLGVGKKAMFSLGATIDPVHSEPIKIEAYVKSLHDGIFTQEGPAGRGIVINIGPTAVLNIKNIDIVVCHKVSGNGDPQLYRSFGIEPKFYQLVIVKACSSYRAAYQLFADVICPTDTPGAASTDLLSLNFEKLPKTFYPFSSLDDYQPSYIASHRP